MYDNTVKMREHTPPVLQTVFYAPASFCLFKSYLLAFLSFPAPITENHASKLRTKQQTARIAFHKFCAESVPVQ